jgi:DNA polymerase III delta subunit
MVLWGPHKKTTFRGVHYPQQPAADRINYKEAALKPSLLLLYGPEGYLRRRAEKQAVREYGLGPDDVVVIDEEASRELDVARMLDELRTPGLFSRKKGVVLREAGKLLKEKALVRFVKEEFTKLSDLLLVINCEKPPAALVKAVDKAGRTEQHKRLYATDYNTGALSARSKLGQWIRKEAGNFKLRLDDETVLSIIEASGQDPAQALELLEALSLTAAKARVTPENVEALTGAKPADAALELERAVLGRDLGRAMRIINDGYREGIYRYGRYTHSTGSITAAFLDALVLASLYLYRMKCGGLSAQEAGVFRQRQHVMESRAGSMSVNDSEYLLEAAFRAEWLFKAGLARGRDALTWLAARFCGQQVPDPGSYGEVLTRR